MKKIKKRKGSIELLYLIVVILLSTSLISSINSYYRSVLQINEFAKNLNINISNINNVNIKIAESIQSNNYSSLKQSNDYNIKTIKLTTNFDNSNKKNIIKDYSMANIEILNKNEELIISKKENNNYFLFTNSLDGISIGYSEGNEDYIIGDIDNMFYYGIEKSSNLENLDLYISSKNNNTKLFYLEFDNNEISKYDFYIAKIEKANEIYYTIYIETDTSIIEAYSFN